MKALLRWTLTLVLLTVTLTACGGDAQTTSSPATETPQREPASPAPTPPTPAPEPSPSAPIGTMRGITATEAVAEMKIGVNIASLFDNVDWGREFGYDASESGEAKAIAWSTRELGNVYDLTDVMREAGYNAVRLTVSYTPHMDDETFEIDAAWLDEVEKAVQYILGEGMYCIIDSHVDYLGQSWVGDRWAVDWMLDEHKEYVDARFSAMWGQIATRFRDYGDYLIFEAMNEPMMDEAAGDWDAIRPVMVARINGMNEIFVDVVRETGGNNQTRFLLLGGAVYNQAQELENLALPDDPNIIVGAHCYPFDANEETQVIHSEEQVREQFAMIDRFAKAAGVPVIMGEWGIPECFSPEERVEAATRFLSIAKEYGVPCFWWECAEGVPNDPSYILFTLFDRASSTWRQPDLLPAMMDVVHR